MTTRRDKRKLGELLLEAGLIDTLQLSAALSYQKEWGGRLGSILIRRGIVSEQDIFRVIEKQTGIPCTCYADMKKPSPDLMKVVRPDIARKFCIFPLGMEGRVLSLATTDPTDLKTMDEIGFHLNVRVKPVMASEDDIEDALSVHYENQPEPERRRQKERKLPETPVISNNSDYEIIHSHQDRSTAAQKPRSSSQASDTTNLVLINSIIELLIEKGVFTRDELLRRLRSREKGS